MPRQAAIGTRLELLYNCRLEDDCASERLLR